MDQKGSNICLNYTLGGFYHLRAEVSQTIETRKRIYYQESSVRIAKNNIVKVLGPDNPRTRPVTLSLLHVSWKLSET
jgi:hypothetical protein